MTSPVGRSQRTMRGLQQRQRQQPRTSLYNQGGTCSSRLVWMCVYTAGLKAIYITTDRSHLPALSAWAYTFGIAATFTVNWSHRSSSARQR
ncbi:hypothetical protein B0I35DRAFT_193324 [Stachybotrys elegans]|uniref:Uncharacterized protein n=1 Tax=Stachybotrys elegans TaxID=80388 RepID=A0A8K0WTB4_9HYPO|nr:hypothetical protein B0I35DRAFT_193324 [Stachybotrys elegans]